MAVQVDPIVPIRLAGGSDVDMGDRMFLGFPLEGEKQVMVA